MDTTHPPPTKTELILRWGSVAVLMILNFAFWWAVMSQAEDTSSSGSDLSDLEAGLIAVGIIILLNAPPVLIAPTRWFTVGAFGAFIPAIVAALFGARHHFRGDWLYMLGISVGFGLLMILLIVTPLCLLRKHLLRRRERLLQEQTNQETMIYTQQPGVWPPPPT